MKLYIWEREREREREREMMADTKNSSSAIDLYLFVTIPWYQAIPILEVF